MSEFIFNKSKKYIILILIAILAISCFYFLDSSNGATLDDDSDSESNNDGVSLENDSSNTINTSFFRKYSYNESSNVILEFTIGHSNMYQVGGGQMLYINISLHYKENNMPIPYRTVFLTVGNTTKAFVTDENGTYYNNTYHPYIFGNINFQVSYHGSEMLLDGEAVFLEPVSLSVDYYLSEWRTSPLYSIINPDGIQIIPEDEEDTNFPVEESLLANKTISNENNSNDSPMAHGAMKETGFPLIQLILSFMVVLGAFFIKNSNY